MRGTDWGRLGDVTAGKLCSSADGREGQSTLFRLSEQGAVSRILGLPHLQTAPGPCEWAVSPQESTSGYLEPVPSQGHRRLGFP